MGIRWGLSTGAVKLNELNRGEGMTTVLLASEDPCQELAMQDSCVLHTLGRNIVGMF